MKRILFRRAAFALPALVLALAMLGALAVQIPAKAEVKSDVTVYQNSRACVDCSNLSEGFVSVKYTGGKDVRIKAQVIKSGGTAYTYNLDNKGGEETFPLVEGDGTYRVRVLENTTGTRYAQVLSCEVDLELRNEFLPFLYPNQYVNFTGDSQVVSQAAELCEGRATDLEKLTAIYEFVINNFTYDHERAASVQSGYLPDVDDVLAEKKGICFDYSAVMAAMLRSENIPAKLVIGYAGTIYHAWLNVYLSGEGWVEKVIYFDGEDWTLMDPTFASTGKNSAAVQKYITDDSNYTQKYAY